MRAKERRRCPRDNAQGGDHEQSVEKKSDLNDAEVLRSCVARKQRRDSIEQFTNAGRPTSSPRRPCDLAVL